MEKIILKLLRALCEGENNPETATQTNLTPR